MTTSLRDALSGRPAPDGTTAKIYRLHTDGTLDLDFGGGRIVGPVVMLDTFTPTTGRLVSVMQYPNGQYIVLGVARTANASTQRETLALAFPFNVLPGTGAPNPLTIPAASSGSYRSADGWAWLSDGTVAQGANSTAYGYYKGCWFYGDNAFAALAGRTVTHIAMTVARKNPGGGVSGAQVITAALHAHGTRPAGEPTFINAGFNIGSLAWGASAEFDLPVDWGQALVNGTAKGVGLLRLASGNGNYSLQQPAGVSSCGHLRIWCS